MTTDHPGQMPGHQVVDLMRAHERTQMPYAADPTPQPDPAAALAGRLTVVSWEEHERLCAIAVAREHHRMAARTADAAARLAAVEALTVEWTTATCQTDGAPCSWHRVSAECAVELTAALSVTAPDAREGAPSSSSESSGHVDAQTTGQPEAMRLDAPDAGQREAQERAPGPDGVALERLTEAVGSSASDAADVAAVPVNVGDLRRVLRMVAHADRSPEQP